MTNFDTGNSWDAGVGGSHDVLQDVTNSPTRAPEDDAGWVKPPKHDDADSQKATWSHDEGANTGDTSGKLAGGCFRCGSEDHIKTNCPEKPAGSCFRCGSDEHMKVDCLEPPKPMDKCFSCGEVGHSKADCTNEKVAPPFTGTCYLCQEEGHRASQYPTVPARRCKNCQEPETDSHSAAICTNRRKIHRDPIKDGQADEAWKEIVSMTQPGSYWDMDDLKVPLKRYTDAITDATYVQLENAFRDNNLTVYIIAADKQFTNAYTLVDLQGNIDREYAVWFRKGPKPTRPYEELHWPATKKDNLQRLLTAGEVEERGAVRCNGCGELGHTRKNCKDSGPPVFPQDSIEHCLNCNEEGHRLRNCSKPCEDKNAYHNCKQSGHQPRECTEPRNVDTVECNTCNEMGHYSRDCPTGGGGGSGCFNCDSTEHQPKECLAPRHYSRVKCSTCGEMGHAASRCKPASTSEDVGEFAASSNSWGHPSGGVSSSAPVPTKISSSGWVKVSKGDAAAEDNVAVTSDGGWGNSSTFYDTAPANPAASSTAGPAQMFPEVNLNHEADTVYSAYRRDYAPRHETSIGGDSPWTEKIPTNSAPRVDQPVADKVVAVKPAVELWVKTVDNKNVADETDADKVVEAKHAAGLWVKNDTSKTVVDKSVADTSVGGPWGKTGAHSTATKTTAANSTVANNTTANNTVTNEPAAGPWDPWGIPATIGAVDETTGTDRIPQSTGSPFVAARNMNPSGGPAALKPLFLDDGRNRHNSDLASYVPVPYLTRMWPSASSRDEREDDDIPRAGGFGGGASSPENDDTIVPETTTPVATRSTAPRFAYQPSRGPGSNTSAPRQQKPSGPPYGVSVVFPPVERVSPAPIVPQPGFVGRPRTHTMVQPARPLMAPQFRTPSLASTASPSQVVAQGVAPGGSVGRPRRESFAQPARPMMVPHRAAPSPPSTATPSPIVTQGVAPAELVSRPRRQSIIQPVRPIVTPRLTSPSAAVTGSPMPVVAQGIMSGGGRQHSPIITQPANPFVPPHMAASSTASSTANAMAPPQMSTPPRPPVSPDFPFRDMEHLEHTPPPHGLDVFFDGESSESAVVDDELPTPTQATFPPSALAPPPPDEIW